MPAAGRIKVTHILTRPELGGAQVNTIYTVRHLDRDRFAPSLITAPDGPLAGDAAAIPRAEVIFVPDLVREIRPGKDWRAGRKLVRLLRALSPQIVHTHSSKAGMLGRWAARRAGVPVVVHTVHGFPFHDHQPAVVRRLFIGLERAAARLTDRFVCVSRADVEKGRRYRVFDPSRATLIRSGIDIGACRAARGRGADLRAELGLPGAAPLVGMVACFKPQKDPVGFVRVAALVRHTVPDARFLMIGDGELRPAVEAARREEGLDGSLLLAGWRRDIPAVMDACDVVVLTSLHEGLPRVIPEAMACARPVVATAVDGTPEAVSDGVTGYLVPPRDAGQAAGRIVQLLRDPAAAQRMGGAGARRVTEFDIVAMVRRQEELYLDLLGVPAAVNRGECHARC